MVSRDATLLARTAEGDAQAFQQLVDRHSSAVLNVIYRIVLSRADAEDLCQEVFVRLWKQAPSWQDEAKLSTWLYRVASNLAINHSQRVQQRFVVDGELAEQLADASTPLNDEPGDSPALTAALSALPEEQRAAIAFRYYREMPVREIADVLGNSPKAVESLLGRARKRLRQLLGENNDQLFSGFAMLWRKPPGVAGTFMANCFAGYVESAWPSSKAERPRRRRSVAATVAERWAVISAQRCYAAALICHSRCTPPSGTSPASSVFASKYGDGGGNGVGYCDRGDGFNIVIQCIQRRLPSLCELGYCGQQRRCRLVGGRVMTKRKGLLIALVSSLVINALLIGSWVGHRLHGDPIMHSMSRHILKRPPETLSEQAREVLKAERGAMRKAYRNLREKRRGVAALLSEQPLDTVALAAALAEVREADVALKRLSHEVLLQVLPPMPPEERLAMLRPHKRKGDRACPPKEHRKPPQPPVQ